MSQLYVSQIHLVKPYPSRNSIISWAKHNSYIPLFNFDAYFMLEELHLKCSWPIWRDWSGHIWHSLPSLEYSHSDLIRKTTSFKHTNGKKEEKRIFCLQSGSDLYTSDREKLLKFETEGQEFAKFFRSVEQFIQAVKGQYNFWNGMFF